MIDAEGRALLVRHGYRPGWHFPGGGVERGESVVDAALRELQEETGVVARGAPTLHGIFNNNVLFAGDHVVLYTLRAYEQVRIPMPSFEIAEQGFFAPDALPPGVAVGTRRRIAEIFNGEPITAAW